MLQEPEFTTKETNLSKQMVTTNILSDPGRHTEVIHSSNEPMVSEESLEFVGEKGTDDDKNVIQRLILN